MQRAGRAGSYGITSPGQWGRQRSAFEKRVLNMQHWSQRDVTAALCPCCCRCFFSRTLFRPPLHSSRCAPPNIAVTPLTRRKLQTFQTDRDLWLFITTIWKSSCSVLRVSKHIPALNALIGLIWVNVSTQTSDPVRVDGRSHMLSASLFLL